MNPAKTNSWRGGGKRFILYKVAEAAKYMAVKYPKSRSMTREFPWTGFCPARMIAT
jgi:hypothetical protein